ncbi:MAG TPA: hypothetical protein PLJ55_02160, partial [Kiritimatiellia bacterium]|nr:hypothetical protein [Kiritimatiellia bacterium]
MEKLARARPVFSTLWKNFAEFFHAMEKLWRNFPHNGKTLTDFSTQWKIGECRAQVRRTPGERELYSDRRSRASKRAVASAAANFAVIFPQCGKVAAGGSW